jgi:biopolymer transport protein TolR
MSDINMTPLIDVMLVLLVIFIITAPLLASSIKLDLPKTDAAKAGDAPKSVTVVLDAAGQTYVKDSPVAMDELARQLTLSAQANPQTEVLLRADKVVPYGRIVEVMGAAQKAGLNRIGFVADASAPTPTGADIAAPAAKP